MMTNYTGIVFTGIGVGKTRVQQNLDVYKEVTGMELIPGTLNVRLDRTFEIPAGAVIIPPDKILPIEKSRGVTLVPAKLRNSTVLIMIPEPPFYDKNEIEIMAPFNIRERFGLKDGDDIEIIVE